MVIFVQTLGKDNYSEINIMRILFVGDASNYHNCLASALRELGHETFVISNGNKWANIERDATLGREPGPVGAIGYIAKLMKLLPRMRGYDIVYLVSTNFLLLRPGKIRMVFDYLKRNNRVVILSALGTDCNYVRACLDGSTFRYSDFRIGDEPSPYILSDESEKLKSWLNPSLEQHTQYVVNGVDGIVACLYEYYKVYQTVAPEKLCYGAIPIDTRAIEPRQLDSPPERVQLFIGIQRARTILKGTDRLLAAAKRVHERHPDKCEIRAVENIPYKEYVAMMRSSHVILDQLYSYTPSTNALLGMASGLVAVSGAEPEYYDLIGERDCRPIVNALPYDDDALTEQIEQVVLNADRLPELSRMSREHVVKHYDSLMVARRHIDFWDKIISSKVNADA